MSGVENFAEKCYSRFEVINLKGIISVFLRYLQPL
jgi:hypothetical protein